MNRPASSPAEPAEDGEVRLAEAETDLAAAGRLVGFSDGVVAIAITLLVLELPVPRAGNATAMLHEMGDHLIAYYAFFISFAVIAAHWTDHHRIFRWVRRLGGGVQRRHAPDIPHRRSPEAVGEAGQIHEKRRRRAGERRVS